ncbi:MAG: hypothetical protein OEY56_11805 [Cyclobacteriaceae bacterium]|nr:hypothetical protein [Cyclobacteriaceae bacterium]
MAKKQLRHTPSMLINNLRDVQGLFLNFVLKNGAVQLLQLDGYVDKKFILKDAMHHKIILHLQDIDEIWQDVTIDQT